MFHPIRVYKPRPHTVLLSSFILHPSSFLYGRGRDGLDEIYAYGLRNPYRMSFDIGGSHDLLASDAGQGLWEEVSLIEKGGNYGWNVKEGTSCFNAANNTMPLAECPDTVGEGHPDEGAPLIDPVIEYANANQPGGLGLVVVGGHVYRGDTLRQCRAFLAPPKQQKSKL